MAGIVGGIVGAVVLIFAVGFIIVRRMVHRNTLNFGMQARLRPAVGGQNRTAIPFLQKMKNETSLRPRSPVRIGLRSMRHVWPTLLFLHFYPALTVCRT